MKNIGVFVSENFQFLEVIFFLYIYIFIYLNRSAFVMGMNLKSADTQQIRGNHLHNII